VDDERFEIVSGSQAQHFIAERVTEIVGSPLARAGGENLERVAAEAVGAFGGIVDASGSRSVDADAAGSEARRAFGRGTGEDILLAGHGMGHLESISRTRICEGA
jgi:hypothetical protein